MVWRRSDPSRALFCWALLTISARGAAWAGEPDEADAVPAGLVPTTHLNGAAVEFEDGDVLVCGGVDSGAACDRFSPRTKQWSPAAPLRRPRIRHALVRLGDGRVLAIGGETQDQLTGIDDVEVLTPNQAWAAHSKLPGSVAPLVEHLSDDGRLWIVGPPPTRFAPVRVFAGDVQSGAWEDVPGGPMVRPSGGGVTDDGDLFIVDEEDPRSAHVFDLRLRTWTKRPLSERERGQLHPVEALEPVALREHTRTWGRIDLPLSSGGALEIRPFDLASGHYSRIGLTWLFGAAAASIDPCDGVTAMVESFGALPDTTSRWAGPPRDVSRARDPLLPDGCRKLVVQDQAPRLRAALARAANLPIAAQFVDFFACTMGMPPDIDRMKVVLAGKPYPSFDFDVDIGMRARCLATLATSSAPMAGQVLGDYAREKAITISNETTPAGDSRRLRPTVDPALSFAVPLTPALRPLATAVLRRALAERAANSSSVWDAVCGKGSAPENGRMDDVCLKESANPETRWELTSQRRKRILIFAAETLVAAGVMTAGVVTSSEPGYRAVPVLSLTAGLAIGGYALGSSTHSNGPGNGIVDEKTIGVMVGILGAAAGLGAGLLLSSDRGPGRIVATGLGVGTFLGVAAHDAFADWDELRLAPVGQFGRY